MDLWVRHERIVEEYVDSCGCLIDALRHPDQLEDLLSARSRFNRAAHHRVLLLRTEVLPALRASDAPADATLADAIAARIAAFDTVYHGHLGQWTLQDIFRDWTAYRYKALRLIEDCSASTPAELAQVRAFLERSRREGVASPVR